MPSLAPAAVAAFLVALLVACATPTRSTLGDPSEQAALAALTDAGAADACSARRADGVTPPHPFTSDGCSVWPDADWVACCLAHDVVYWCGGNAEARAGADRHLRACVSEEASGMGGLMWLGVRAGGAPWLPAPWRWGYGWDYPAGYTEE